MAFTAKDVSVLRERTGCGMMDCKKALTEANGDMDKAVELLREKGLAASAKKAGRIAAEGIVLSVVDEAKKTGVIIEVNSETDFVAKNDSFVDFVKNCANAVLAQNPVDVTALLAIKDATGMTIEEQLREKILTISENIKIRRFSRYEGDLVSYVHGGGRIGVLVKFDTDLAGKDAFREYAKDIAMQIAALNPLYVRREDIPAEVVEQEKEILKAQIAQDEKMKNKPEAVIEKMIVGRLNKKLFQESCLVEQAFVKDGELTVGQYTEKTAKELGGKIAIVSFERYEKGEGIEKRECDFASEVAGMIK
jgi:elongation factor Ts